MTILLTIYEHSIFTPDIQMLQETLRFKEEFSFSSNLSLLEICRAGFVAGLFLARSVFKYDIIDLLLLLNAGLEYDTTDELYPLQDLQCGGCPRYLIAL
jgi:hypothetical protein